MKQKFAFLCLCFFLILGGALYSPYLEGASAAPSASEKTLVLYDATSGILPSTPLMSFSDFPPGAALPSYSDGTAVLDTTTAGRDTYAGWISRGVAMSGFPILDRSAGFQVNFTLQIEDESHGKNDRSGFSLLILSDDAKGIELAFWENSIWAQSDGNTGGLFNHGEGVLFPTTTGLIEYRLMITGDTYTLTADTQPVLSGPVRDYSDFEGFPDPYQTPNFLFLGDDTTSAQARVRLGFVSVTGTEPLLPTGTSTSTSTSSPPPTVSPTALPSVSPIPSPTPTGEIFQICPSGSFFLVLMITTAMLRKGVRVKPKTGGETASGKTIPDQNQLL